MKKVQHYTHRDIEEMFTTTHREDLPLELQVVNLLYEVGMNTAFTEVECYHYNETNQWNVFLTLETTEINIVDNITDHRIILFDTLDLCGGTIEITTARQAVRDLKLKLIENNSWAGPVFPDYYTKQQKVLQLVGAAVR